MNNNTKWWCALDVKEKERIATKIKGEPVNYPMCTQVWNELDEKKQNWIRSHCSKKHGRVIPEWQEGFMYSE